MIVLRFGICGTDREEASGGRADPPEGSSELVIGHEMLQRDFTKTPLNPRREAVE